MTPRVPKQPLRSPKRPSLAGSGVLDRMRSTTFALLGGTALFFLAIVGVLSQQGFGLLPPLPIPGLSQGDEGVSGAAAVSRAGDSVSPAFPAPPAAATGGAPSGKARSAGEQGRANLGGSRQLDSSAGDGTSQPGSQPSPQPAPTPTPAEPAPTTVSQPTTPAPSSSGNGNGSSPPPSTSAPPKTDAGTAAIGGSSGSGGGQNPQGGSTVPDSVKQESTPPAPPPSVPTARPVQTDAEKAAAKR